MHTLLFLSTISLAAATTNKGLGYLQCASSIARTYHNTECTSPSALDCFCNAPFNPDTLDQETLDNCASEGVSPTSIPTYICSDTTVPVPARKGSTPMMRVAGPSNASTNDSLETSDKERSTADTYTTRKSNLRTAPVVNTNTANTDMNDVDDMNMTAEEMRNMDMRRAYAPDPDTEMDTDTTNIEENTDTQEATDTNTEPTTTIPHHHNVHMTDASNANVVYKVFTETRTDCACDLPGYSSPTAPVGVEGTNVNVPATQTGATAATGASTGVVDGVMVTATATATATATDTGAATSSATDEAGGSSSTGLFATLASSSSSSAGSVAGTSSAVGAVPSGVDSLENGGEGDEDDYGVMFTGGAGAVGGRRSVVGMMVVAGLAWGWILS
ncbi:hypothetical protein BO94DRAFT_587798 [Aspergillus sclerotioniger CBS 115572]|uniref:Extracellular membrane protein CFEM domain-containing protein n=1 Tax=Aspergillus sclerotioniger CBS 115572 TaxID=1450535 RepID=A0A317W1I9_9EURO|nr:hypothetical protein BO94DRAFT_587798 [Aspergillus sclerotioniger CBS 115572]PWY80343.1 hypothetical protein BO94DRAFT_587798 [Aspergillus sclerotioniger CBS 115572]